MRLALALVAALIAAGPSAAQEAAHEQRPAGDSVAGAEVRESLHGAQVPESEGHKDMIMPHIVDSHELEIPWPNAGLAKHIELPRWPPIHVGSVTLDLSPTKHVVMMLVAATLAFVLLFFAGRAQRRYQSAGKPPKGVPNAVEAIVLYMRNEVVLPNVGAHGEKYVPFVLTLFFFILFANVLGLIPYGSTPTSNISVTATLAIITFFVIELAGMRALGKGYLGTIVYWPHDMPFLMKAGMTLIMTPVEIIGKLTKPFALAIRLFANMTAGHVMVLALIGMIFTFGSWWVVGGPFLMAVGIMLLELFVAFLQAFIFAMLASVFIGQIRESAH
jgi:F-type H+-transporting ATPase subunit a